LRYIVLAHILLSASATFARDIRPSCEIAKEAILSRSPSGLAQVSNLGGFRIKCWVPPRPFPTKPGEVRYALKAATTVYEISTNGSRKPVPSEVHYIGSGGGRVGPDPEYEWIEFDVLIPLDSEELKTEVHRYLAKLQEAMTPEQREQFTEDARKKALENLGPLVYQQRVGHFRVDCQVLDSSRVAGTDVIEVEVLFKGRFSDFGMPGFAPA